MANDVPAGRLKFYTLSNPRFSVGPVNLPAGGMEKLDLILDWGSHEIRGRVVDRAGKPVPASQVTLQWRNSDSRVRISSRRQTKGDANGFFRFTGVGTGLYSVTVFALAFQRAQVEHSLEKARDLQVQLIPAKDRPVGG